MTGVQTCALPIFSALPDYGVKDYSIDRINNNGNYEPGNLRWTTRHIQGVNCRIHKNNTTGYVGISKHKNKWQSEIGNVYLGCVDTLEEAISLRNNYIIANNFTEYKIQEVRPCQ